MSKLLKYFLSFVFLPLIFVLFGVSTEVAAITDKQLEIKVLDIIRKHPQVILESVEAHNRNQQQRAQNVRDQKLKEMQSNPRSAIGSSPVKGAQSGAIVMVEFSDFQCPYCSRAHDTVQEFMTKYGNEVTLTYKHLPLVRIHPQALPAALASWSAQQQGKFWEYHDRLFAQQSNLGEALYVSLAKELGLDVEQFNRDRQSDKAQLAVKQDIDFSEALAINGTPAFYINGRELSGAVPLGQFEALLAEVRR